MAALEVGKKTAIVKDGRKKIHTVIDEHVELVEVRTTFGLLCLKMHQEFDINTDELLVRKWRRSGNVGTNEDTGQWEYEIGEPLSKPKPVLQDSFIAESANNVQPFSVVTLPPLTLPQPILVRKDSREHFIWRIRNLPYTSSNFQVSVDAADRRIVVRTVNKKYFKRIEIPDMARANLPLHEDALSWRFENNTLIIQYKKPREVLAAEEVARRERASMKAVREEDCAMQ